LKIAHTELQCSKKKSEKTLFYSNIFQKNKHILGTSHRIITGVGFLDSDSLSTLEIDPGQFFKSLGPLVDGLPKVERFRQSWISLNLFLSVANPRAWDNQHQHPLKLLDLQLQLSTPTKATP
jgi:hypothetical protein